MLVKIFSIILSVLTALFGITPVSFKKEAVVAKESTVVTNEKKNDNAEDFSQTAAQVDGESSSSERRADYDVLDMYYAKYEACLKHKDIYTKESFEELEKVVNSIDWNVMIPESEAEEEYPLSQVLVDVAAVKLLDAIHGLQYESFSITFHANNGSDADDVIVNIIYGEETSYYIPSTPVNVGYVFCGWYDDDGTFEHLHNFGKMKGNCDVYAKWELAHSADEVNITVVGGATYMRINGQPEEFGGALILKSYPVGTRISLRAAPNDDGIFLYWYDENDRIVSTDEEYDFIVETDINLHAQYTTNSPDYSRVVFVDRDNRIVSSKYVKSGTAVDAPNIRANYHTGYLFDHWDRDLSCVTEPMIVRAVYCKTGLYYNIVAEGGVIENKSDDDMYAYDEEITVKADEMTAEGKFFAGWSDDGGKTIISDKKIYSFRACRDTVLEAIYGDIPVESDAFITIKGENLADGKIRFMTERSLPDGCRLAESGILITNNPTTVSENKLNLDMFPYYSDIKVGKTVDRSPDGQYAVVISAFESGTYCAVGYIVYIDTDGAVHTQYSEIAQLTVSDL